MNTLREKRSGVLDSYVKTATVLVAMSVLCLTSNSGCSSSRRDDSGSAQAASDSEESHENYPDFQEPDETQSAVSFFGWLGDSAVLTEEVYTDEDSSYAEYYIFRPGTDDMEPLEMDDSLIQNPGVIVGGVEVAPLHGMNPKEPFIELYLAYDSAALAAVQAQLDEAEDAEELPEPIGGLVGVIWHRPNIGIDTLWIDSVYVGPYYGDTEVEYHMPEVTYAEMSPSRRSLMVALWLNDYIEYFVFDLTGIKRQ